MPIKMIYIVAKKRNEETEPSSIIKIFKKLIIVLFFNFLLGSALLKFLQPNYLANWMPTGWQSDYILLAVIAALVILLLFIFIPRQIYQLKKKEQSLGKMFLKFSSFLITMFFVFSCLLWGFNALFAPKRIELESPVVLFDLKEKPISVVKISKTTPNGTENGITTSFKGFLMSAIDLHTGKKLWSRISTWQEYLVGETSEGLLVLNNKKKTLYFIDPKTGKKQADEKDFLNKFPLLENNLSYMYTDYSIKGPNKVYLYGLDGRYFKLNLATNEIKEDPSYADKIRTLPVGWDESVTGVEKRSEKIKKLYPELMGVRLVESKPVEKQLIVFQKKRNDNRQTLALLDLTKRDLIWEQLLDAPLENATTSLEVFADTKFVYAWTGRYQYKINKETGKVVYQYDYKLGK
ncbi:PA2928 family protein [Rummeliibacillus stabekisii]|uniref:PA2928 family protein n=1 Tax=Rummeliibacillus stabekisii TaxID=241244 RepID=UPI00204233E5|nr:PA2928 family protein [Rummeliibacillus stabekisii]